MTDLTLADSRIELDEEATATAIVANQGSFQDSHELTLRSNGTTVNTEAITVDAGENRRIELSFEPERVGEFELSIGDEEVGVLDVDSPATTTDDPEPPEDESTPTTDGTETPGDVSEPPEITETGPADSTEPPEDDRNRFVLVGVTVVLAGLVIVLLYRRR